MFRRNLVIIQILFLCSIALVSLRGRTEGLAQDVNQWAPYQRVYGYGNETRPPYLIADQNHTVHAFTSDFVGENNPQLAIVYRQWSFSTGWSEPVDILFSPLDQARTYGAFLDNRGVMQVLFFGGADRHADMYFSQAPAGQANDSRAWSEPELIGLRAITPSSAALAGDDDGNLVVLYSGDISGFGIYEVHSTDYGQSWSVPEPVFFTEDNQLWPWGISLDMGESGQLHAVWNVVDPRGHNISGHYTSMDMESFVWSEPIEFDRSIGIDEGMGIMNPVVIEHDEEILILYNNGVLPEIIPPAEWLVTSNDGGITWSSPTRPFPEHVGRNGMKSFAVDSNNNLHVFFVQRIQFSVEGVFATHSGIWHSQKNGRIWTKPEPINTGISIAGKQGEKREDLAGASYDAIRAIVQGNQVLVTSRADPGGDHIGVWYSQTTLDAPELPAIPLPQVTITSIISETDTNSIQIPHKNADIDSDSAKLSNIQGDLNSTPEENQKNKSIHMDKQDILIRSVIPVLITIAIIIIIRLGKRYLSIIVDT